MCNSIFLFVYLIPINTIASRFTSLAIKNTKTFINLNLLFFPSYGYGFYNMNNRFHHIYQLKSIKYLPIVINIAYHRVDYDDCPIVCVAQ